MQKLITPDQMLDERYHAHIRDDNDGKKTETLLAHSGLALQYYERYCADKGIDKIVKGLIATCGFQGEEAERAYLLFVYAIYLHDFGKINPCYQYDVLRNEVFRNMRRQARNANHSLASAFLYIDHMHRIFSAKLTPALEKCMSAFAYCISKHHGRLGNGREFSELEIFDEAYCKSRMDSSIFENVRYYMQEQKHIAHPFFSIFWAGCFMR